MAIAISNRLKEIANFVTRGYTLADIGTDHGYVPIYLVEHNDIPHAIAMDVKNGPLEKAKENIRKEQLDEKIETRLSDGLEKLEENETDSILIAGMGGPLVVKILTEGSKIAKSAKELILSPQSELAFVRRFLEEHQYQIVAEKIIYDEGKYYTVMKVKNGHDYYEKEYSFLYGKADVQIDLEIYMRYLHKELSKVISIEEKLKKIKKDEARISDRKKELEKQKKELQMAISDAEKIERENIRGGK